MMYTTGLMYIAVADVEKCGNGVGRWRLRTSETDDASGGLLWETVKALLRSASEGLRPRPAQSQRHE